MRHVLIVEDDATLADLLAHKFTELGWAVTKAPVIETATQMVLATGASFSHAIIDLNVGHQSGLTLIRPILDQSPACNIVVVTGYASVQTTIEAIKLGAKYLLAKPARFKDIIAAFSHTPDPHHVRMDAYAKTGIPQIEWETIQATLAANNYNISKTADVLGMHRRTLQRKLKKSV